METVFGSAQSPRVALVYDRLNSWGGAERVLLALQRLYPDAPLFTSVFDEKRAAWARSFVIKTTFLQRVKFFRTHHRLLGWLMPFAFETLDFSGYDLIISVTSEAAKGVLTRPGQLHICYLLTPTRYLWSHEQEYRQSSPWFVRPLVKLLQKILRKWDVVAAQRPDTIIPISRIVRERAETFYDRTINEPLYPGSPALPDAMKPSNVPDGNFIFSWGRMVPYKRFDVVVQAATEAGCTLVLAGTGPEFARLKKLAQRESGVSKIHFVGTVTDAELSWYLDHAECAVFPQREDFGIAPLEAVSRGCPVIVHCDSGVSELLSNGKDGVFIADSSVSEVVDALGKIEKMQMSRLDIQSRARQYAEESFQKKWKERVQALWKKYQST